MSSLFQAVTPRTAGFNTVELTDLSEAGQFITIALMLIGGSPGSTAGGLKTTTIAVLLTTAISTFRRRENANLFGRRIDDDVVKNAATISLMYITLCCNGIYTAFLNEKEQRGQQIIKEKTYFCNNRINKE